MISGVISMVTVLITHRGLIALLIATHEPPSILWGQVAALGLPCCSKRPRPKVSSTP